MNQILVHIRIGKSVILTCLLLSLQTPFVCAAEDITGEWEIKIDQYGFERVVTLSFSRKADGSLMGKWASSDLADVQFENGKLSFTHIIATRARDFKEQYAGTLKEGKLTGTMSGELGAFSAEMTRKKPKSPALGQWDMKFNVGERQITGRLTISENPDGTLAGKWDTEFGEHMVSNIKFHDGKLTYTRKSKFAEREWESTFEGTIKGHKLAGAFKSQRGEVPATGERVGAALVGTWELTQTRPGGTSTSILKIDGDLTGKYQGSKGEEMLIKNVKLEGNEVTFFLEFGSGDLAVRMCFKGKLYGKTLLRGEFGTKAVDGKLIFAQSTNQITGKKID